MKSLSLFMAGALTISAHAATVIYQDNFSGAAGDLNGSAPTVHPGSQTWVANDFFDLTGSGSVAATQSDTNRGAYLPFTPVAGRIYDLQVTVAHDSGSSSNTNRSLQLGFLASAPSEANKTVNVASASGGPALFYRYSGYYEARAAGAASNSPAFTGTSSPSTTSHTLRIVLDTTSANWTVTSYFDGAQVGGASAVHTYTTNPTIAAVGISANLNGAGASGTFTNFILSETIIPEPSSALLAAAGIASVAFRRRRI